MARGFRSGWVVAVGLVAWASGCRQTNAVSGAAEAVGALKASFPAAREALTPGTRRPVEAGGAVSAEAKGPGADAPVRLTTSGVSVELAAIGPRPVEGRRGDGLAFFPAAYPDTDVVRVESAARHEELLVLRGPGAPRRFEYAVRVEGGRLGSNGELVDAAGLSRLRVAKPWALDARGRRVEATLAVDADRLAIELDPTGLELPVLLDPAWESTVGAQAQARFDAALALLSDGRVLSCGGTTDGVAGLASCERYDPSTATWSTEPGPMAAARLGATATSLSNGTVLVCGGGTASCETYDPVTRAFTAAPAMAGPRRFATATALASGKVLMALGDAAGTVELYDPTARAWTSAGSLAPRAHAAAVLLGDGRVLVIGGAGATGPMANADLYAPSTGTWTTVNLPGPRSEHTATRLRGGGVLVAGGTSTGADTVATALFFDEAQGTWRALGAQLTSPRRGHAAALLPSGKVVLAGGTDGTGAVASVELFDGLSKGFWRAVPLTAARERASAVVLPSGDLLVAGGRAAGAALAASERYTPGSALGPTGSMALPRAGSALLVLQSGKVLVAGGINDAYAYSATAELYDPATGAWAPTGAMAEAQASGTLFELADGGVLLTPGLNNGSGATLSPERWDPATGQWTKLGTAVPQAPRSAVLLKDGRVLTVAEPGGGVLFDPATATWAATPPLNVPRNALTSTTILARPTATLTLLPSGKALLVGGLAWANTRAMPSCEIFDPAAGPAGAWQLAGPLGAARADHSATVLGDGRVFVTGGLDANRNSLSTAELFDPTAGTWSWAAPLSQARSSVGAVLLPSGRVLVLGGAPSSQTWTQNLVSMELYDPALNRWLPTAPMAFDRGLPLVATLGTGATLIAGGATGARGDTPTSASELYREQVTGFQAAGLATQPFTPLAAVPLPGGKLLVLGSGPISTTELYDPSTGVFSRGPSMLSARTDLQPPPLQMGATPVPPPYPAALMPNGKVLVAGGGTAWTGLATAEIYDPVANSWTAVTTPMGATRYTASAVALLDGRVLVAGAWWPCPASVDLFDPSTGTFTSVATPTPVCASHLVLLANGRVLADNLNDGSLRLFDPSTNTVTLAGFLRTTRRAAWAGMPSATLLTSGKVLFAGGLDATAELFDPSTGVSTLTGSMSRPRSGHAATLLPSGKVLVAQSGTPAELYDPATGTWSSLGTPLVAHEAEVGAVVPAGVGLLIGSSRPTTVTDAELSDLGVDTLTPARPIVTSAPAWATAGDVLSLSGSGFRGPSAASGGTSAGADVGLPVLTLQRADGAGGLKRFLAASVTDTSLTAVLPSSLGVGYYLLFVSVAGVPSVGWPLRIGQGVLGGPCTADVQCQSAHCINSVCCAAVCPACQACNLGPSPGVCANVAAGAEDGRACTITRVCDGAGLCRLRTGQACLANADCQSGFCVDGVCCQGGCAGACVACNLPGSPGLCLPSPAGQPGRAACSGTSSCDGAGACKKAAGQLCAAGTECATGRCADAVCCDVPCTGACLACNTPQHLGACSPAPLYSSRGCAAAQACDGAGACKAANGQACTAGAACASGLCADGVCCAGTCGPCQACNLAGSLGACANVAGGQTTASCAAPNSCDGQGRCLLVAGKGCAAGSECASGSCADGVCCDSACAGTCQACNLAGHVGACTAVASGAVDPGTCVAPKACDGAGKCALTLAQACTTASACLSGFCSGGVCCDRACTGACESCSLGGSLGACAPVPRGQGTSACVAPKTCDGAGACALVQAQACTASTDCLSGHCVDGVCCGTACAGVCQSCAVAGRLGQCSPVPRGAGDADTCAAPALCDGAGACLKSKGQACAGPAECLSGACVDGLCCEGACASLGQPCTSKAACASGQCVDGVCCASDCAGTCRACNVPGASGQCTPVPAGQPDPDTCAVPNACDGAGACAMKPAGQTCASAGECQSGHCVDGTCCDSACSGTCVACDVAGRKGTCTAVPRGSPDHRTCVGPQACDGAGACLWNNGQPCGDAAQCVSGACVNAVCCENACSGQCRACNLKGQEGTCAFVPAGEQDRDCTGLALACDGSGRCKARDGVPCTTGAECASGHCIDGLCCNSACDGACQACGVPGHLGACSPVPQGQTFGGRACEGACDGQGACKRAAGQGCATPDDCASSYCEKGACQASGPAAADPNLFSLPRSCSATPDAPLWAGLLLLGRWASRRRRTGLVVLLALALAPAAGLASEAAAKGTFTVRRKPAPSAAGTATPLDASKTQAAPASAPAPSTAAPPAPAGPEAKSATAPAVEKPETPTPAAASVSPAPAAATLSTTPGRAPAGAPATHAGVLKVAFLGMQAGVGVEASVAELVGTAFLASIQERPSIRVMGPKDLQVLLSYERQRQLVGCGDATCLGDIGDALGADLLLSASLGRLGETVVFNAQLFSAQKGQMEKRYSSQATSSGEEALLDLAADGAVGLFGPSPAPREKAAAGRVVLEARLQALVTSARGGAVAAVAGYRVLPTLSLGGGVLVTNQVGLLARAEWVPFNVHGRVRPVVALEVPVLFSRALTVGAGGSLGVQLVVNRWLAVGLEVPGTWFLSAPPGAQRGYLFGGMSVVASL